MALAIWVAVRTGTLYSNIPVFVGIIVAVPLSVAFRWLRGAKVADVRDGPILRAFLLARFTVTPAVFLLALFSAAAWALRLEIMAMLWLATGYALIYGFQAIMLTTVALELALGIKGRRREPLSGA